MRLYAGVRPDRGEYTRRRRRAIRENAQGSTRLPPPCLRPPPPPGNLGDASSHRWPPDQHTPRPPSPLHNHSYITPALRSAVSLLLVSTRRLLPSRSYTMAASTSPSLAEQLVLAEQDLLEPSLQTILDQRSLKVRAVFLSRPPRLGSHRG
jgi:hypothetical protein